MKSLSCLLLLLLSPLLALGQEETLPSSLESMPVPEQEQLLAKKIQSHLVGVERQLQTLDNMLNTYYKDYNYTEEDALEYVSNPINT